MAETERSDGLTRMALAGLAPETAELIWRRAEQVMREFDGAPENFPEFQEAQRILRIMRTL